MYLVLCKWQLQNTLGLTPGVQILTIDYNGKNVKSGMKHECDIYIYIYMQVQVCINLSLGLCGL